MTVSAVARKATGTSMNAACHMVENSPANRDRTRERSKKTRTRLPATTDVMVVTSAPSPTNQPEWRLTWRVVELNAGASAPMIAATASAMNPKMTVRTSSMIAWPASAARPPKKPPTPAEDVAGSGNVDAWDVEHR